MDARARTASAADGRVYEDVQPQYRLNTADRVDTLTIDLRGLRADGEEFRKEHLRILVDNYGNIKVSGERPLASGGNRWRRFQKVHRLPEDCDASAIRATFDDAILYVVMPKLVREQPPALVPATEPAAQAPAASTDHPANGQQQVAPKPEPPAQKPESTEAVAAAMSTPPRAASSRAEEGDRAVAEKEEGQMGAPTAAGDSRQSEPTAEVKERRPWPPASVEEARPPPPEATAEKHQKHRVSRIRRPRHLLVNVAVAVLLLAGLGFYFINRKTGGGRCHA